MHRSCLKNVPPGGVWQYLTLVSETPSDVEVLRALESVVPRYDPHHDQLHGDRGGRARCIFPVIENPDGSHELRLVCIPPNDHRPDSAGRT